MKQSLVWQGQHVKRFSPTLDSSSLTRRVLPTAWNGLVARIRWAMFRLQSSYGVCLMFKNSLVHESVEPVGSCLFVWSKPSTGRKSELCTGAYEADCLNVVSIGLVGQPGVDSTSEFFFVH